MRSRRPHSRVHDDSQTPKTAKALGIDISDNLLSLADEVFE